MLVIDLNLELLQFQIMETMYIYEELYWPLLSSLILV